ncbi:hypothetical protein [Candidatus Entotheonella palauensis]|uniref:hypothetical protein n=1 Tax=Candidatus Entotheonella palauensis TaxID=93172 RepID=UPI001C4E1D85|nr:hypothetical protein [Candidatus Entotheonella palauensis]
MGHTCSPLFRVFAITLLWGGACMWTADALAHHGGIGIEGDLVEWALNVDQWQEEQSDQGHRIKFLAYPRQPVRGRKTRLVFEIQAMATGRYVSGLAMQLHLRFPDGTEQTQPLPETTGVTAYYEAGVVFEQVGEHGITVASTTPGAVFQAAFKRQVSGSAFVGDWTVWTGNLTVLAALTVTWLGLVLSVQRRFLPAQPGPYDE